MDVEDNKGLYKPGSCNIGKEEISRRKKLLAISFVAVAVFTFFCLYHADSLLMKICLFISIAVFVIIYIEVRRKFCITLGMMGYFNFGKPGKAEKIKAQDDISKDRKKAMEIAFISIAFAVLFILLISFLAKLMQ